MTEKRVLILLFIISVSFAAFFAFGFDHPVKGDAERFNRIAINIANNGIFSLSEKPPYSPTMLIEPMYPFSIGLIYKLFGHKYIAIKVSQILIFGLTIVLVYFLTKEITKNAKIARITALITALCPTLANYPSYLLTETIFTFLLCLSVFTMTKAIKTEKAKWFMISGVIIGITALCKGVMLFFFLAVLAILFILKKSTGYYLKRKIQHYLLFMVIFLSIISPWSYRNYKLFGTHQISFRGELALWMRAIKVDQSMDEMKIALVCNFSEFLGKIVFPDKVSSPGDFMLEDSRKAYSRQSMLIQSGLSITEANRQIRNEALMKIKRHPLKYLAQTFLEFEKMLAFLYIPTLNETHTIEKFQRIKNGRLILACFRGIYRLLAYPLFLFALIGIFVKKKDWESSYFPIGAIIYINLIYSLLFGWGRYAVPLIPLYLIFAAIGFTNLIDRLKS